MNAGGVGVGLKEGKKGRYLNRNFGEREKELKRLVFVFVIVFVCVGVCGRVNECF